jgi:hypothetical protein
MKKTAPLMMGYLVLSLMGLVIPVYFNFIADWTSLDNPWWKPIVDFPVMSSFTADLFICASAAILFMVVEGKRIQMKNVWVYIILSMVVAIAFAFPLFLYMRERQLKKSTA